MMLRYLPLVFQISRGIKNSIKILGKYRIIYNEHSTSTHCSENILFNHLYNLVNLKVPDCSENCSTRVDSFIQRIRDQNKNH